VGVEIDAALMPTRETGMTPYEILLSESQERMLVVAKKGRERAVEAICRTWELGSAVIGRVTDDGMYRVRWGDEVVAEIPGRDLVDRAPVYKPEARESAEIAARRARPVPAPPADLDAGGMLERLLDLPTIASKRWVYEQYDQSVQAATVLGPGGDAAVLRVRGTPLGVAVTSGASGRYVWLDPYEGGKAAVAEAARNVAATGARPLGITDCLNFGNPEKPEVFYQFREACRGIADACRALDTPVTGGNVSFYNESPAGAVLPTPVVGMVGVLADVEARIPAAFRSPGDVVLCLGTVRGELGGSQYLSLVTGDVFGAPPHVDLAAARSLVDCLVACAEHRLLASAHDVSEGGLAVALAEAAALAEEPLGLDADLSALAGAAPEAVLFGEDQGVMVVSAAPAKADAVIAVAREHGVAAKAIGRVGALGGAVRIRAGARTLERPAARLREIYEQALPRRLDGAGGTGLARGN
jgi:phosphoribosylformylglycinamidine synthase subunit PurL